MRNDPYGAIKRNMEAEMRGRKAKDEPVYINEDWRWRREGHNIIIEQRRTRQKRHTKENGDGPTPTYEEWVPSYFSTLLAALTWAAEENASVDLHIRPFQEADAGGKMLNITLKYGESFCVGGNILVSFLDRKSRSEMRVGILAPPEIYISRMDKMPEDMRSLAAVILKERREQLPPGSQAVRDAIGTIVALEYVPETDSIRHDLSRIQAWLKIIDDRINGKSEDDRMLEANP